MLTTSILLALAASPAPELEWHHGNLDAAIGQARDAETQVLIYFWADGSQHCASMYGQTLQSELGEAALADLVLVSANVGDGPGSALMRRFGVQTMPTCLVLGPDGQPDDVILGYAPPDAFAWEIERILKGEGTVTALRTALAQTEDMSEGQFAARLTLAAKLTDVGVLEESEALRQSIRKDDPKGKTLSGAEVLLDEVVASITVNEDGEELEPEQWDLDPVYKLAKKSKQDTVRYQAWNRAANLEANRGDMPASRKALVASREFVPDSDLCNWSQQVTWYFLRSEDELTSKDYAFAVDIAAQAVKFIEGFHMGESDEVPPERCWTGSEGAYKAYLARYVDGLAWAHYYSGDSRTAIELAARCRELDPEYEEYATRAETFAQPIEG
ncbi:thioredoxin family protein [Engelhardtia mirabilis]|uniref:Thiol:disulfide interchange protein DsbD n=1 Tax=Engelhardtia mirabilis TaxID=2528011 RepID=A0A518BG66_9BACT|nr:Thiol:disulfide interchange protein DsbD [Planctomycetes bacterium Pla133]QDV00296.1 Thiol:disulfide interchange protein DsbD [Planctomycetes bacterium Pla86]